MIILSPVTTYREKFLSSLGVDRCYRLRISSQIGESSHLFPFYMQADDFHLILGEGGDLAWISCLSWAV